MHMIIADVISEMESWAPTWTAWERDNVGLQVGDASRRVRRIGIALDITQEVVDEAIRKKAGLIISHHPLLFHPPRTITSADRTGALALQLIENRIAVYSSHTNLDSTSGGVNTTLAKALGLTDVRFLSPLEGALVKIAVFVPVGHTDAVHTAFSDHGAGVIGQYTSCSFNTPGIGTFKASASANPYSGTKGSFETAEEVKVEAVVPRALVQRVVTAVRAVHPYDEMAYDLYPVENIDPTYGLGAIGNLKRPVTLAAFLRTVKRVTTAKHLRVSGSPQRVRTVAVCGGSGSDLIRRAQSVGADVFVTADVRYHAHQGSSRQFAVVDAGHWETEHLVLPVIAKRIREALTRRRLTGDVYVTRINTNSSYTI